MSTSPASAVDHSRAIGPPPVSRARCSPVRWSQPARRHDPGVFAVEVALLRPRRGRLVPRVPPVDRVAERVGLDEHLLVLPVVVERRSQKDADAEVDVHQVVGDRLAVHDDAGRDVHRLAPLVHVLVLVVAHLGIVPRAPAAEQDAALADLLVAGQRFVEEVEQVVVQRHDLLHELDVLHQADDVVGEELLGRHGADAAGVKRGGMDVPAFHQAEHLARHAGSLPGLRGRTRR